MRFPSDSPPLRVRCNKSTVQEQSKSSRLVRCQPLGLRTRTDEPLQRGRNREETDHDTTADKI